MIHLTSPDIAELYLHNKTMRIFSSIQLERAHSCMSKKYENIQKQTKNAMILATFNTTHHFLLIAG